MAKIKNPVVVILSGGGGSSELFQKLVDKSITSVSEEDFGEITSIGDYTFSGCIWLESVELPTALTAIGNSAFMGCSGLIAVYITDLAAWCAIAFGDESANPLRYAHNLYLNNALMTSLPIPNSVTSIGHYAFYGCSTLTGVTIGSGVASIGNEALAYCSGIASIEVDSENATYHDDGNCLIHTASETLVLGCKNSVIPTDGSVTIIGDYAFEGCTGSTTITIPDDVTNIGNSAFKDCTGITTVTIPDTVTNIGSHAFDGCSSFETIIFLGSETKWNAITKGTGWDANTGSYVMDYRPEYSEGLAFTSNGNGTCYVSGIGTCTDTYIRIPPVAPNDDSVTSIGASAFANNTTITDLSIPDSVTSIGSLAFNNCAGLMRLAIPNTTTRIDNNSFWGCGGLESISVDSGNSVYHSSGNCLIKTYNKDLLLGCKNSVIPTDGSVRYILAAAFRNCIGLTSLTIPIGVTSIGNYAFQGCNGLVSITIPNTVTEIGQNAFISCTGLTSVTIPNGITAIRQGMFSGCSGLTSVTIPDSVTTIEFQAFAECSSLTSITIPNTVITIGQQAFMGCTSLTSITIPGSVTSIGGSAFYGCSSMTSATVEATTPPTLGNDIVFIGTYPIYVPDASVSVYQSTTNWISYGNRIQANQ